jgi:microcystin synthetase protein McyG
VERPVHVLALSARSEAALAALATKFADAAEGDKASIADVCFTANTGRAHHAQRLAVSATDGPALVRALRGFSGASRDNVVVGRAAVGSSPRVAFLFTGQGSQYPDMGRELYETEPRFREELDRCDELLRPYLAERLLDVMYGPKGELLDQTSYTQPALFALEWCLAQLWRSWGVVPRAVMGHSVGELVAACFAGVMGLEDGLRLVAARAQLMQALPTDGGMAALRCDELVARRVLQERLPP